MPPTKQIMLLGANGQVGQTLRAEPLPADWQLAPYGHAELDITNHAAVRAAIESSKPDIIINAAAFTNVDAAEKEPQQAMAINFEALANLAALCTARDVPIIHISTDYVFDGAETARPYREDDQMHPLSVYGESKMMGEEALRHEFPWHVILRISSVFGAYGKNLLTGMLQIIDEREEIKALTDMKACPTAAAEVAKALIAISAAILKGKHDGFGTFHFTGAPEATRLEFTQAIMDAYAPYTSCRPKIIPATAPDFGPRAARPPYSALDCTKIKRVYGIEQKPWRDGLAEAMAVLMRDRRKVA